MAAGEDSVLLVIAIAELRRFIVVRSQPATTTIIYREFMPKRMTRATTMLLLAADWLMAYCCGYFVAGSLNRLFIDDIYILINFY